MPRQYTGAGSIIVAVPDSTVANTDRSSSSWQEQVGDTADMESVLHTSVSPRLIRMVVDTTDGSNAVLAECELAEQSITHRVMLAFRKTLPAFYDGMFSTPKSCTEIVADSDKMVDYIKNGFKAKSVGRSRLIEDTYTSALPHVAQTMANLLIGKFIDDQRAIRVEPRDAGVGFLRREIARVDESLRADEAKIQIYRKAHDLLQGQFASLTAERLSEASKLLAAAEAAQANAAGQLQALGSGDGTSASGILSSVTISNYKRQAAEVSAKLARLMQTVNPESPLLAPGKHELADIDARIQAEIKRIEQSVRLQYEAANTQVTTLSRHIEELKKDASQAGNYETQIASMIRDTDVKRLLY